MSVAIAAGIIHRRPAQRELTGMLLAGPLILFMLVFYIIPVAEMLLRSVSDPHWSLGNYRELLHDQVFGHVFLITVRVAFGVTLGTLLLGYPVALALARLRGGPAAVVIALVLLPFWTSVLVRSYAWMVLLGRHGLINEGLIASGLIATPLRLLNTSIAVYVAMIHILLPYLILPIAATLRQIDPALPRAAAGLGASPWRVFRQVVLPLSMPGVAAGMLLVFVLSLGFYITPALVGGPHDMMVSMLIAQQVDLINWPYAACLSATLLAMTLLMLAIFRRLPGVRALLRSATR